MAEILAAQSKAKFGSVKEISAIDYVDEVNKAGDEVWVILHLYKSGYPCRYLKGVELWEGPSYYIQVFLWSIVRIKLPLKDNLV